MSEIPEDIMQRARELDHRLDVHQCTKSRDCDCERHCEETADIIARALLAERKDATERAAKIAEDTATFHLNASKMCLPIEPSPIIAKDRAKVATAIASAIRSVGQ